MYVLNSEIDTMLHGLNSYKTINGDISNLRVWLRMAELIEPMKTNLPYATYMAKELTQ